jgi:predicted nucleic acid-binding protein
MIVIDASVAFKWFDKTEENNKQAKEVLRKHLLGEQEIIVPDLFLYELTNAWSTKSNIPEKDIIRNLQLLGKYELNIHQLSFKNLCLGCSFSRKYNVSVYDAIYAIIAQEKKCNLVTADEKFAKLTKQSFIMLLRSVSVE